MISKKLFVEYISEYQEFDKAFDRLEEALMGKKYGSNLYEADWYQSVGYMLDTFLESHFTESGIDLISTYLYENCHEFWINKEDKSKEHYTYNTLEELYDVMLKFKNDYFLNV